MLFVLLVNFLTCTQPPFIGINTWKGSSLPGKSFAEFSNFSGKQDFTIEVPQGTKKVKLKYEFKNIMGKLNFIIKSSSQVVLSKPISGDQKDEITFDKSPNENYKFYLVGKKAQGSYMITYNN